MWSKGDIYIEQPKITFTSKYYMEAVFVNTKKPTEQIQFDYSSVKPIRDNIQNSLTPPTLSYSPVDRNKDGVIDQYNITMRVRKPSADLALQQMHIVMAFDYEISDLIHMKLEGLANVNIHAMASSKLSASKLKTQGHLNLRQPNALP